MSEESKFRPVNATLGTSPSVGALPGNQFVPWILILILSVFLGRNVLNLSWLKTGFLLAWFLCTWSILTGNKPWIFLSKLYPFLPNWTVGYVRYTPLLRD